MSRRTKWSADRRYEVAFGHDHACGWFVQVWDHNIPEDDNPYDEPTVNLDETQTTRGECSAAIIKVVCTDHGVAVSDEELEALQAATPRRDCPNQGFLDFFEAVMGNPTKGDA